MSDLTNILLALVFGAIIGFEREWRDKSAGLRTLICISVGSATFTLLSYKIGGNDDATRIAANIVTGVGFLGAGVLLKEGTRITGLTTAALVWLTAAVGMACGSGNIVIALKVTFITVIVMWILPIFEHWVDLQSETRNYKLDLKNKDYSDESLKELTKDLKLYFDFSILGKTENHVQVKVFAKGCEKEHRLLIDKFLNSELVQEFSY